MEFPEVTQEWEDAFWCPFTPAGSMLAHLQAATEAAAWSNLIADRPHGRDWTRAQLLAKGFTVDKLERKR